MLRVTKTTLSGSKLEELLFKGEYRIDFPNSITDINSLTKPYDKRRYL